MLGEPSIILRLPYLLYINTDWCFTTCTTILIIMDGTRPWLLVLVRYNSAFVPLCSPNTCKDVFNPNVNAFQSNCAEGLHFSAFILSVCLCVFPILEPRAVRRTNSSISDFCAIWALNIKRDFSLKRFVPKLWRRLLTSSSSGVVSGILVPLFQRN